MYQSLILEIRDTVTAKGVGPARVGWMRRVANAKSAPVKARSFGELRAAMVARDQHVKMLADIGRRYLGL